MTDKKQSAAKGVGRKSIFIRMIAEAFVESGYRGTTTAELARRCNVRENELYRIWPSKKKMFLDAIDYVYAITAASWEETLQDVQNGHSKAEQILDFQSRDHGKMRLFRIVFAGLMESDDKEIRAALRSLYRRFSSLLTELVADHRVSTQIPPGTARALDADSATWAIIGIGTIVDIQRELGLLNKSERERFMRSAAGIFLAGDSSN